jgi:hypothetical protein
MQTQKELYSGFCVGKNIEITTLKKIKKALAAIIILRKNAPTE